MIRVKPSLILVALISMFENLVNYDKSKTDFAQGICIEWFENLVNYDKSKT